MRQYIQYYINYNNNISDINYNNLKVKYINHDIDDIDDKEINYIDFNKEQRDILFNEFIEKKSLKKISYDINWTADIQQDYKYLFNALNDIFNNSINITFIIELKINMNNLDFNKNYILNILLDNNININNIKNSLFININRYHYNGSILVKYDYILNPSLEFENNDKKYNLQSILLHYGNNLNSGHYTCIFKCNDNWYLYNDGGKKKVTLIGDFNKITNDQKKEIVGLYYI